MNTPSDKRLCDYSEDLGLAANPPPVPKHDYRHPQPDPQEYARNQLTQCQQCWKPKTSGITLLRCGACKIEIYCMRSLLSKECQKMAWPEHKLKCKFNRNNKARNGDRKTILKQLLKFKSKHRPTIAEAAIRALELSVDLNRCLRDIVVVYVRLRDSSTRAETRFYVTGSEVLPLESFPFDRREDMREQLILANQQNIKAGMVGALFVVLVCLGESICNIVLVGFDRSAITPPGTSWKEWMMERLNEGIVN